jgi:uncharacterized repeat protein (TIGR01451 family)
MKGQRPRRMLSSAARRRRGVQSALAPLIVTLFLVVGVPSAASADIWTFVQVQRVNSLTLRFDTDTFAPNNAFGGAFVSGLAQNQMQSALASSVADGSTSWLLEMRDLTDLSGTSNPSFHVGVLNATPAAPGAGNPVSYDGTSDLDWWYLPDPADLAPDGSPIHQLSATFTAKVFNAGTGRVRLNTVLGGVPTTLAMSMTNLQAVAGDASAPLTSTNGLPPGHLPEENLPDSLTSFESMSSGKLAGRISAGSLAATQIPAGLVGTSACTADYRTSNTMLDLLITGCTMFGITLVRATQPDTVDPAVGSGVYRFTTGALTKHVTGCTHDGAPAMLSECLGAAAYSSYFQFTTDRVIDLLQVHISRLLTVARAGSGSGTVTSAPAGIDCGEDCTEPYDNGAQVTLIASPSQGSRFDGWTGCDNPSGMTCGITMDADKQVTASFVQQHILTVSKDGSGTGSVTSSPAGIDCGAQCSETYDQGTQITLTATAASGSTFTGWSGACTGIGTCAVTLAADQSVTATFAATSADIRLAMSGPASAPKGAQVTYLITVSNEGPATAHNVVLTNPLPSGASFLGITTNRGSCAKPSKGVITCSLGDLAKDGTAGSAVSLKLTAKVGRTVTNLASAYSTANASGPATPDQDPTNNSASVITAITK